VLDVPGPAPARKYNGNSTLLALWNFISHLLPLQGGLKRRVAHVIRAAKETAGWRTWRSERKSTSQTLRGDACLQREDLPSCVRLLVPLCSQKEQDDRGLVASFVIRQQGGWSERTDGAGPGGLSSSMGRRYLSALLATSSFECPRREIWPLKSRVWPPGAHAGAACSHWPVSSGVP
jgi:hypothetical protein